MNNEEIKDLAELARLELSEEDITQYQKDFKGILDYISTINSVDIDGFDDHVRGTNTNIIRVDDESYDPGSFTEVLLDAAPERDGDFIKVAKIL